MGSLITGHGVGGLDWISGLIKQVVSKGWWLVPTHDSTFSKLEGLELNYVVQGSSV